MRKVFQPFKITIDSIYLAKVGGRVHHVKIEAIAKGARNRLSYHVRDMINNRRMCFRGAWRFRIPGNTKQEDKAFV